jgi:hypothetical protein
VKFKEIEDMKRRQKLDGNSIPAGAYNMLVTPKRTYKHTDKATIGLVGVSVSLTHCDTRNKK